MEHYINYAKEKGLMDTGIHTRIGDLYRVSSAYRKYSNPYFETWGWETLLWNKDKIEHQYEVLSSADDVVLLHTRIVKHFWEKGEFYKEEDE